MARPSRTIPRRSRVASRRPAAAGGGSASTAISGPLSRPSSGAVKAPFAEPPVPWREDEENASSPPEGPPDLTPEGDRVGRRRPRPQSHAGTGTPELRPPRLTLAG